MAVVTVGECSHSSWAVLVGGRTEQGIQLWGRRVLCEAVMEYDAAPSSWRRSLLWRQRPKKLQT